MGLEYQRSPLVEAGFSSVRVHDAHGQAEPERHPAAIPQPLHKHPSEGQT